MDLPAARNKLLGFGMQLLDGIDPNPDNMVCAGIIHTQGQQVGCLLRLEPNRQAQVRSFFLYFFCYGHYATVVAKTVKSESREYKTNELIDSSDIFFGNDGTYRTTNKTGWVTAIAVTAAGQCQFFFKLKRKCLVFVPVDWNESGMTGYGMTVYI